MRPSEPWLERAHACAYTRSALTALGVELPADDAELDRLLGLAVMSREATAFTHLMLSALSAGRRVKASHLTEGVSLFGDLDDMAASAFRLQGDVGAALVTAVQQGRMTHDDKAVALLVAGLWGQRQPQPLVSPGLIPAARMLARDARGHVWVQQCLMALAQKTGDESLAAVLRNVGATEIPEVVAVLQAALQRGMDGSVLDHLSNRSGREISSGFTMRRAVARIGRNDPCPCGSGKKYKRCCLEKDHERLQHSSEIEGITQEERDAELERHVTLKHIEEMRSHELARLDPLKLPPPLHASVIRRLARYEEFDRIVEFFEAIGFRPEVEAAWDDAIFLATEKGLKGVVRRLLAIAPEESANAALEFDTRLSWRTIPPNVKRSSTRR